MLDTERVFSRSSASYLRVCTLSPSFYWGFPLLWLIILIWFDMIPILMTGQDSPTPSTQTTPSHAATPSSMYNGNSGRNGENSAPSGPSGPGSQPGSVKGGNSSKNKKKAASGNSSAAGRNGNGNGDEDAGDDEKQPVKRLKITYSRE